MKKSAEDHWNWKTEKKLLMDAFVHGYKHKGKEVK